MKKIVFILMLVLVVGCNGQDKNINPVIEKKQDTITYYNSYEILKYIEIPIEKTLSQDTINAYKLYEKQEYVKGNKVFKLKEFDDVYLKTCKLLNQNFIYRILYDKSTLKLKRSGVSFINMPIGVHQFYDENGNITEEKRDFDKGFELTVDNFILKVKRDLDIDLNKDIEGIVIGRGGAKKNKPTYYIRIPMGVTEVGYYKNREILINGKNGKIIRDEILVPVECGN